VDEAAGRFPERFVLRQALAGVSVAHRAVVVLHLHAGYTLDETAGILGIPRETVRSRLRVAREQLRKVLGEAERWTADSPTSSWTVPSFVRILAEQGAEIEAAGIAPATAAARVRLMSRTPAGLTYRPGASGQNRVQVHQPTLRTRFRTMNATLRIAAVAVLALVVGIGVVQLRPSTNYVGSDPSPSPSPSPLVWTPASIEQDWPAPVREEPVGDPVVIQAADGYLDPQGDIESPDMPWIDILRVQAFDHQTRVDLGGGLPSGLVAPGDSWIAYGLVFDTDLDGVADVRLGMDRVPAELTPWGGGRATGDTTVRAWRTDLRTGVTEFGNAISSVCDCLYPEVPAEDWLVEVLGASVTPPPETVTYSPVAKFSPYNEGSAVGFGKLPGPFYAWASMIQDGRVVATDYTPDTGWLVPTVEPEPSGSPSP
jgi:hypothetical protein